MQQIQHCIITRFNVPLDWNLPVSSGASHIGLDEQWLESRFELFERVCYPSVKSQSNGNFDWLVFLDPATPERFVLRMDRMSREFPALKPVYTTEPLHQVVFDWMNRKAAVEQLRITTRLDNDDAIHPQMVERIHKLALRHAGYDLEQGFFISFPIGCCEREGDYYLQRFFLNPFVSFVSNTRHPKTVIRWQHTAIAKAAPVVFSYTRPMWCQVIHGRNVINTIRGIYLPFVSGWFFSPGGAPAPRSIRWRIAELFRSLRSSLRR